MWTISNTQLSSIKRSLKIIKDKVVAYISEDTNTDLPAKESPSSSKTEAKPKDLTPAKEATKAKPKPAAAAEEPVLPCEQNEVIQISMTSTKDADLDNDFVPIVELDKTYAKDGFEYANSSGSTQLSAYIEKEDYPLEVVKFEEREDKTKSKEIVLRFSVNKGNSGANDNKGSIRAIGNGVKILSQSEFTIKYDEKIRLRISDEDIKPGAYIDFYANDNDWKYYSVSNVHCGRVRVITGCGICGLTHGNYDLRSNITWQTQFNTKWGAYDRQKVACKKTCDSILNSVGLKSTSSQTPSYQMSIENTKHSELIINTEEGKKAVNYLKSELSKGRPILIGVNHTLNYKAGNADNDSTDHFVVVVGCDCDVKGFYYIFYEVATTNEANGSSDENRLYLNQSNYSLTGTTAYSTKRNYTVTQVRQNI